MADSKQPAKRLGTLDSQREKGGDAKRLGSLKIDEAGPSGAGSRLAGKFRPKNFARPDNTAPPSDAPVAQKPLPSHGKDASLRRNRRNQSANKYAVATQEVVFGGVIGAGAKMPEVAAPPRAMMTSLASGPGCSKTDTRQDDKTDAPPSSKSSNPSYRRKEIAKTEEAVKDEKETIISDSMDTKSDVDGGTSASELDSDIDDGPMGPVPLLSNGSLAAGPVPPELLSRKPENFADFMSDISALFNEPSADGSEPLMLMQLPSLLPIPVPPRCDNGGSGSPVVMCEDDRQRVSMQAAKADGRPASLSELPPMKLGKIMLLKSGKVCLQIGDVLFDVSPGVESIMRQELAIVDSAKKECTVLGSVERRVMVTPDLETLLSDRPLPQWKKASGTCAVGQGGARRLQQLVVDDSDDDDDAVRAGVNGDKAHAMELDAPPKGAPKKGNAYGRKR